MKLRTTTTMNGPSLHRLRSVVERIDLIERNGATSREHDEDVTRIGSVSVIHRIRDGTSIIEATSPDWHCSPVELRHDAGDGSWNLRSSLDLWMNAARDADEGASECGPDVLAAAWVAADATGAWPELDPNEGSEAVRIRLPTPWSAASADAAIGQFYEEDHPFYMPMPSFRRLSGSQRPGVAAVVDAMADPVVSLKSCIAGKREVVAMEPCMVELRRRSVPEGVDGLDAMDRLRILATGERASPGSEKMEREKRTMIDPRIEYTQRGFAVVAFTDAQGRPCSLQDSSIADEACIWFGRDGSAKVERKRMHLTAEMAAFVLAAIDARRPDTRLVFEDRYGSSCCVMTEGRQEDLVHHVGIITDFEGMPGESMAIDGRLIEALRPMLTAFIGSGTIASAQIGTVEQHTGPVG
jgi:hypothetical protein